MNDKTINFEEDKQEIIEKTDLDTLSQQCYKLQGLEKELEDLEKQVKKKKEEYDNLSSEVIPDILAEQGITSIKLSDGSTIEVRKVFSCTIPKDPNKKEACYEWLRQNDLGDIVKNNVREHYIESVLRPALTCPLIYFIYMLKIKLKSVGNKRRTNNE